MTRPALPPRLVFKPDRLQDGRLRERHGWQIKDGKLTVETYLAKSQRAEAEQRLAAYLISKAVAPERGKGLLASDMHLADVLATYITEKAEPDLRNVADVVRHCRRLNEFWGAEAKLADVTKDRCRGYAAWRKGQTWKHAKPGQEARRVVSSAWHELKTLRAAVRFYHAAGYCSQLMTVEMPPKPPKREAVLEIADVARLVRVAWRARQAGSDRRTGQHVARFVLLAIYTGSRAGVICSASPFRAIGRSYVDLERGWFHRLAEGRAESRTKKSPDIRLPDRLLVHLRRWHRLGISQKAIIEWDGEPVRSVRKAFKRAVIAAGLDPAKVTPHTLRHTAATWAMRNSGDAWQVAGYLGMSREMLEEYYAKHRPDHQADAIRALSERPKPARPAPRQTATILKFTA